MLPVAGEPGVPKSTFGLSRFSGFVTWKYFLSFAPVIFAVSTAGNWRMYALYCCTARVVVRLRRRDAILRARELVLQPQEALVALELRIRLGDGDQPTERAGHLRVRVGHLLGILALHGVEQAAARARDLAEHRELLVRHPLHRRHEVRDQVGATLELHLDLPLRGVRLLVELLDRVVPARAEREREEKCEPPTFHGSRSWEG